MTIKQLLILAKNPYYVLTKKEKQQIKDYQTKIVKHNTKFTKHNTNLMEEGDGRTIN